LKYDCLFCNWYSFSKDAWKRHLAERHGVYYTRWHEDKELPSAEKQFDKVWRKCVGERYANGIAYKKSRGDA
jgi:hypothetical protein